MRIGIEKREPCPEPCLVDLWVDREVCCSATLSNSIGAFDVDVFDLSASTLQTSQEVAAWTELSSFARARGGAAKTLEWLHKVDRLDGLLGQCSVESVSDLLISMGLGLVAAGDYVSFLDSWQRVAVAANSLGAGASQGGALKLAALLEGLVGEDVDRLADTSCMSRCLLKAPAMRAESKDYAEVCTPGFSSECSSPSSPPKVPAGWALASGSGGGSIRPRSATGILRPPKLVAAATPSGSLSANHVLSCWDISTADMPPLEMKTLNGNIGCVDAQADLCEASEAMRCGDSKSGAHRRKLRKDKGLDSAARPQKAGWPTSTNQTQRLVTPSSEKVQRAMTLPTASRELRPLQRSSSLPSTAATMSLQGAVNGTMSWCV